MRRTVRRFNRHGRKILWESELRSYQNYLIDRIVESDGILGAAEMALGKTGATLTAIKRILEENPDWKVLVVGPIEVARKTWPDECENWEHLQCFIGNIAVAIGDEQERLAALAQDATITTINRENLQWLWRTIGGKAGWKWKVLIYDESSRLKGWSLRTKGGAKGTGKKRNLTELGVLAQARSEIARWSNCPARRHPTAFSIWVDRSSFWTRDAAWGPPRPPSTRDSPTPTPTPTK